MKQIKKYLSWAGLSLLAVSLLGSCKDDVDELRLSSSAKAPMLKVDASQLDLDAKKADEPALVLSWTKADFGFSNGITNYILEFKTAKGKVERLDLGSGLKHTFTHKQLNSFAIDKLGFEAYDVAELKVSLIARLYSKVNYELNTHNSLKSKPIDLKLNLTDISVPDAEKTGIGIVGDGARGWPGGNDDLEKDIMLTQDKNNPNLWKRKKVKLFGGKSIKFRKDHSWAMNWGQSDDAGFPKGVALINSPNNLTVAQDGEYTVTFNDKTLAYEFVRTGDLN